jgi:hypothetical protein
MSIKIICHKINRASLLPKPDFRMLGIIELFEMGVNVVYRG